MTYTHPPSFDVWLRHQYVPGAAYDTAPSPLLLPMPSAEDAPASRSDVTRLEAQVTDLLRRDEERAAALGRIEDAALCCLLAVEALRERLDRWDAEASDTDD
jgi:hypothetical protein